MRSFVAAGAALAVSFASYAAADCESYGIDFQNGGSYFQNNLSTAAFTALQEFSGCEDDVADNIFVDPNGDQSECSNTPLTPDDTPQLINCTQWPKDTLYSGDWSLIIISNNGNGTPIAYERDFSLSVGPQQTVTVTSTATITDQSTPVANFTSTTTSTYTTTVPSSTTTVGSSVKPTTWTPPPSITATTHGFLTLTQTVQTLQVAHTTKTVAASCVTPAGPPSKDPKARIVPTILGGLDAVASSVISGVEDTVENTVGGLLGGLIGRDHMTASAKFKRAIIEGRTPSEDLKRAYVQERHERLSKNIQKRAPDQPTITVTASNVATSTISQTGATTTQTITSTVLTTKTVTSGIATASKGGKVSTVTAPASTRTITINVPIAMATTTQTKHFTITNTVTTTSAGAYQSCWQRGGHLQ